MYLNYKFKFKKRIIFELNKYANILNLYIFIVLGIIKLSKISITFTTYYKIFLYTYRHLHVQDVVMSYIH